MPDNFSIPLMSLISLPRAPEHHTIPSPYQIYPRLCNTNNKHYKTKYEIDTLFNLNYKIPRVDPYLVEDQYVSQTVDLFAEWVGIIPRGDE